MEFGPQGLRPDIMTATVFLLGRAPASRKAALSVPHTLIRIALRAPWVARGDFRPYFGRWNRRGESSAISIAEICAYVCI